MSHTSDYVITTLSSGSLEYTVPGGKWSMSHLGRIAPISLAIPTAMNLRQTGAPYVVTRGSPSSLFIRQAISSGD